MNVFMLSPARAHEPLPARRRCISLQDANIFNIAIRGVFDDCQDIVKSDLRATRRSRRSTASAR